ncbi:MAG: M48 family metallopeptidase [Gammaproteobacteria bacterium]|nr:M48 family metallopeptidase [Gammaproteobacteria bacterium]
MSFYENQHRARRQTGVLVAYFVAAVVLIVAAVNLVLYAALFLMGDQQKLALGDWLQSPASAGIALITLLVIAAGSLLRIAQLGRGGGVAVALMAGGVPLDPNTRDLKERTLINVTEEMAIASGTPVPRIFILRNEAGINAFVAGTQPSNTVLAVTQGTLDNLTREELQGVIGHEFSHILNGDMGMNLRLIGILAGILLIGQIGEFLLRGGVRARSSRNSKGELPLALMGMALIAVGYIGLFFGRLIKAAIARQREFLADASSVQFTRNPDGIAGALYAIGQHGNHALLTTRHAEDMSHLCFGQTLKVKFGGLLATHPPVDERIKAIDPNLLPRLKARFRQRTLSAGVSAGNQAATGSAETAAGFAGASVAADAVDVTPIAASADNIKASIGTPTPQHADYAHQLHDSIPAPLLQIAHDPALAEAVLYGLLFLHLRSHGNESVQLIQNQTSAACAQKAVESYNALKAAGEAIRLPLLDIALSTLKSVDAAAQNRIIATCQQLIDIDQRVSLSEFIYGYLIRQALNPPQRPQRSIKSFQTLEASLATLFSAIVQSSGEPAEAQARNFKRIMVTFTKADCSAYLQMAPSPRQMTTALDQLNRLTPLLKQPVIDTCVDCALHDGKTTQREVEVLRAVCEALECPLPPVLPAPARAA